MDDLHRDHHIEFVCLSKECKCWKSVQAFRHICNLLSSDETLLLCSTLLGSFLQVRKAESAIKRLKQSGRGRGTGSDAGAGAISDTDKMVAQLFLDAQASADQ